MKWPIVLVLITLFGCNKQAEMPVEKQPEERSTSAATLPGGCTWTEVSKATNEKVACVRSGHIWFWDQGSVCKGHCQ